MLNTDRNKLTSKPLLDGSMSILLGSQQAMKLSTSRAANELLLDGLSNGEPGAVRECSMFALEPM